MDMSKVQLSEEELSLAANDRVMLVKGAVISKVSDLFGGLAVRQSKELQPLVSLLPDAIARSPKVSRGENYRGQPYVVLDHPRLFTTADIFAIRTLFLWGHPLSVTLHLRGAHRDRFRERLEASLPTLTAEGFLVCVSHLEWEHHLGEDNYLAASSLTVTHWRQILAEKEFTKIACTAPLAEINAGTTAFLSMYRKILSLLS